MQLTHIADAANLESILKSGLRVNGMGIVYLSPRPAGWRAMLPGEVLLNVTIRDQPLNSLEDCSDWEVFCWGPIPPEDIQVVGGVDEGAGA